MSQSPAAAPPLWRRALVALAPPFAALALLGAALWWRGPQPDLQPPPEDDRRLAGRLLAAAADVLEGRPAPGVTVPAGGCWYVTAYSQDGARSVTVRAEGPVEQWAAGLRQAWPGRLQADRAIDPPPPPRAGPWGWGLDVGLDGWVEASGEVHLPVSFLLQGYRQAELARFFREHPGEPLRTWSWVVDVDGPAWMVRHSIDPGPLAPALLRRRIDLGADYLVRHLQRDGRFDYAYDARTDRSDADYNLLRHAGTTYSLFQVYRRTAHERHYAAGARALDYLRTWRRQDSAQPQRCFELEGDKVKLGGAGLTLLALVEQAKARPRDADWPWMRCLAAHLVSQTDEAGDMASFYTDSGRYASSSHRSGYYPGEAILGLVELYSIDPDPRWLACAVHATDYLVHRRWYGLGIRVRIPLDAWLLQALDQLMAFAPRAAYLEYAFAIGRAIAREQLSGEHVPVDLRGGPAGRGWPGVVATGSRGEAFAAAARLERRYRTGEREFVAELEQACRFSLRNQYTEAIALGVRDPADAIGGFRSSPVDPVIRIDGVQHNLSALVGLLGLREDPP